MARAPVSAGPAAPGAERAVAARETTPADAKGDSVDDPAIWVPDFSGGLFVCQDNVNTDPDANQNFKYVPLEQVVLLETG